MRYGLLTYWTENLGDTIQSVAAASYLPSVDRHLDRDAMASPSLEEDHFVICNGWWMHPRRRRIEFPFSDRIRPFFVGVHLSAAFRPQMTPAMFRYLLRHAPIGCRDRGTQRFLEAHDVPAYHSSCLTLTLPPIELPRSREVVLVDVDPALRRQFPAEMQRDVVEVSHELTFPRTPTGVDSAYTRGREALARRLLERYARARLVVTPRIHCALPCLAMGTPVVFLYPDARSEWERIGPIRDLLPVNTDVGSVDWAPAVPDVAHVAGPLRNLVREAVSSQCNPLTSAAEFPGRFAEVAAA
jgi:hypothetical protein